ncbi:hypothetical protein ACHAWF_002635, partial [Thalassiosira exigua]
MPAPRRPDRVSRRAFLPICHAIRIHGGRTVPQSDSELAVSASVGVPVSFASFPSLSDEAPNVPSVAADGAWEKAARSADQR